MIFGNTSMKRLRSALRVAFGAGAVLGGAYFLSRGKERQDAGARLERLEQMVQKLEATGENKTGCV